MNVLGMPAFVGYYTMHDPVEGTIGFAPHTDSLKSNLVAGTPPRTQFIELSTFELQTEDSPSKFHSAYATFMSWVLSIFAGFGVFVIGIIIVVSILYYASYEVLTIAMLGWMLASIYIT